MKMDRHETTNDFVLLLQQTLEDYCKSNPRYSLRAFAKKLNIGHSALSQILRGTRPLTKKMQLRLGMALGLDIDQIQSDGRKSNQNYFQPMSVEMFKIVSDWQHDAILELSRIKGFQPESKWIAKKFGLTVSEVNIAVQRLRRLKMLEITKDGKWIDCSGNNSTLSQFSDEDLTDLALQRLQKQLLEKSISALESVSIEKRSHTSITVAINADDIVEIKKRVRDFRRELTRYLERKSARPNCVYQMCFSIFPLTEENEGDS